MKKGLLQKMFPKNGESIPELRFPGFTDPWEQRKFSDLFSYERPDAYIVNNDEYDDSNPTPVLTANKGFILGYTAETRTHEGPCVIFDDFTLDCKLVTFPFMVKSSAMKILHCHDGVDLTFAYERLRSAKIEALGHARHYISVVQNTESAIPSYEEQSAIGRVLSNLDTLITLHQRKYLQEKKTSLTWEQRKLGELVKEGILEAPLDGNHGEKHPTSDEYVESGIPFLMASDIHNGEVNIYSCKYITKERAERLDKGFARNGDVLLTHKATIGETAILSNLMTEYAMLTPQVTYYRIKNEERLNLSLIHISEPTRPY